MYPDDLPDDDLRDDDIRAQDPLLQSHVARSEHADPRDLVVLAADPLSDVHLTLAEWGALPVEAVELLARSPDPYVRTLLVRNRALDPAAEAHRDAALVDDPSGWVRSELLALDLPPLLRARVLAGLPEGELHHPQAWMPEALLLRVIADAGDDEDLRSSALWCLPGDSPLLRELAGSPDPALRRDVAAHDLLPLDLRQRLAADDDAEVRRFAVHPDLGPQVLARLSEDACEWTREAAAKACHQLPDRPAALELLARLARDPDENVRGEVAHEVALHHLLRDDETTWVRAGMAESSADPELLRRLAFGPDPDNVVVPNLVRNRRVPTPLLVELLARLLEQWDDESGLLPGEQPLEAYASWRSPVTSRVLADLVAHPALPDDVVRPLLVHRAPAVSCAALRRLPLDPSTVPSAALRRRDRRGLLWQLLAEAGVDVEDPHIRAAALRVLPPAAGTVSDLAALLR